LRSRRPANRGPSASKRAEEPPKKKKKKKSKNDAAKEAAKSNLEPRVSATPAFHCPHC
jgi:hypothetical protein